MISVYRVEHKETKVGPFQTASKASFFMCEKAKFRKRLPSPSDDGIHLVNLPFCYLFGSPSVETLKPWILLGDSIKANEEIIEMLDAEGYVLAEFLIDELQSVKSASGLQIAFDPTDAREEGLYEYRSLKTLMGKSPLVYAIF